MSTASTRRDFLRQGSAAAAGLLLLPSSLPHSFRPTAPKLRIAAIGTQGMAAADIRNVSHEAIVALCDVDAERLAKAAATYDGARTYRDFRVMLAKEADRIDAVVVACPNHMHAAASVAAMRAGKHVYCEKPLAHTLHEVRAMQRVAAKMEVVTQQGTQIHATENYRRVVEIVRSGAIGKVGEVHVFCRKNWGGGRRPEAGVKPPSHLDWDLWLGPAPVRPYAPEEYHPARWRRFWDFGEGTLGDMGCHLIDLPFWALGIRHPRTIEAEGATPDPEGAPTGLIVRYTFPKSDAEVPVHLTWYDGHMAPEKLHGHEMPHQGIFFVGEKGQLFADYGTFKLYPEERFKDYEPPAPTIPRSIGHWKEWTEACKGKGKTTCSFDYSGPLTETVLLGVIAYRSGARLGWDAAKMELDGPPESKALLRRDRREGWEL